MTAPAITGHDGKKHTGAHPHPCKRCRRVPVFKVWFPLKPSPMHRVTITWDCGSRYCNAAGKFASGLDAAEAFPYAIGLWNLSNHGKPTIQ